MKRKCAHCGRADVVCGTAQGVPLCHSGDGLDCYRLVTIYGERVGTRLPSAAVEAGER